MTNKQKTSLAVASVAAAAVAAAAVPAAAHHSFAMYDASKTVTLTGVLTRFVPQANHAELHFYLLGADGKLAKKDGKNVEYGLEMAGTAAVAQQGITATTFPVGTIFSVKANPARTGEPFGARVGSIAKCPWKTPPRPGQTCAQVQGVQLVGGANF